MVLQYNSQPLKPSLAIQFFPCTPLYCNTIFPLHTSILQYNFQPTAPPYCNTIFQPTCTLLQYNSPLAIQTKPTCYSLSQYNFSIVTLSPAANLPLAIQTQGCNTNFFFFTIQLGSSPNSFCTFFFSSFFLFLPATGRH